YETETRYQRKDGTLLPVNTYISAVSGRAPAQLTFLMVTVDITPRRAAEGALRAAQSELTRVARLTTVGAMAASIAHEINQPLASIVMNGNAGLRCLRQPTRRNLSVGVWHNAEVTGCPAYVGKALPNRH